MQNEIILVDQVGKKFHRTLAGALLHRLLALARKALRLRPTESLGKDEFWALRDVSFMVERGQCLGVIGPNGAGKSTLLKLIQRDYRPDAGRILTLGSIKSLLRIDSGLQPLMSGRENIYLQCHQLGLGKAETDAKLDGIIAFAGLEESIDAQVKTYSDGMYARLEFSIATSVPADIFLVDEVLAVGDIAFQVRALDRLNELKQHGAAIVFVSHSEMNVRQVADHCLLLFNGRQIALGNPDALFCQYYEAVGYRNRRLKPLADALRPSQDISGKWAVIGLRPSKLDAGEGVVRVGGSVEWVVEYQAAAEVLDARLVLQFSNAAQQLVASVDSSVSRQQIRLLPGKGGVGLRIPFMSLTPGCYRVGAGFSVNGQWLAYASSLMELYVVQDRMEDYNGPLVMQATFEN